MKKLIHFGCSFAMGNGVPTYIEGLESGAHVHKDRGSFKQKYGMKAKSPQTCGSVLADKMKLQFQKVAGNGISNEMVVRKLLQTDLKDSFVLIGLTSHNRREALTTSFNSSHWQTYKMVAPEGEYKKFKNLIFNPWDKEYTVDLYGDGQIRTAIQILYMQSYLKGKNVPYLFFNALHNDFDKPINSECDQLLGQVNTKNFYKLRGNFDDCQHGWCLKKELVVSDLDQHPNIKGQRAWADRLEPQIKEIINANR
jgi:hypothetical protein